MDVWAITVALLRRWYVFLPLVALTGVAALGAGKSINPQYAVTATAVLVPGTQSSEIDNPYGSMDTTNTVLAVILDAEPARQAIEDDGFVRDYSANARTRSRIMDVSVSSEDPSLALASADAVLELARAELSQRQSAVGIPPAAQIDLQILRPPSVTEVVTSGKTRNVAVVGVLGFAFAVLVSVLFDDLVGLLKRWRSRRRPSGADEERSGSSRSVGSSPGSGDKGQEAGRVDVVLETRRRTREMKETVRAAHQGGETSDGMGSPTAG